MGFFGPSFDYKEIDPNNYVGKLANENLFGNVKFGMGKAGKSANRIINGLDSGEDVSNFLGSEMGTIDATAAGDLDQAKNQIQGSTAYSGQPIAAAGATADAQNEINKRKMNAKAAAVSGLRGLAYGTYQSGLNSKNQTALSAAQLREKQLNDTIGGYQAGLKAPTGPGIFDKILAGAGAAAAFI